MCHLSYYSSDLSKLNLGPECLIPTLKHLSSKNLFHLTQKKCNELSFHLDKNDTPQL